MDSQTLIDIAIKEGTIQKRPSPNGQKYIQHLIDELKTDDIDFLLSYIDLTKIY